MYVGKIMNGYAVLWKRFLVKAPLARAAVNIKYFFHNGTFWWR